MISFVLVEAENQQILMNLIQYLTCNSLKFTVASDIRRLFAGTYLDLDNTCAGDVSSSSGDANMHRPDPRLCNVSSQYNGVMSNLFNVTAKEEPADAPFSRWLSSAHGATAEIRASSDSNTLTGITMPSETMCDTSHYMDTYPSSTNAVSSLESRAHQIFAAENTMRGQKRSWHHGQNQHVPTVPMAIPKCEEVEKKEKLREVACQLCGKRITCRRCNLRHHAAVVHSGIERYACQCGYTTVHRNTIMRHMLKHSTVETEKSYQFTDMLTPAEAEQIEKLTEECFREYKTVPRGNEDGDEIIRSIEAVASNSEEHNHQELSPNDDAPVVSAP